MLSVIVQDFDLGYRFKKKSCSLFTHNSLPVHVTWKFELMRTHCLHLERTRKQVRFRSTAFRQMILTSDNDDTRHKIPLGKK